MKTLALAAFAFALGASDVAAAGSCGLDSVTNASELTVTLSERAIEIIRRASAPEWKADQRLKELVQPTAAADLGSGDVGRPLGIGTSGIHALAEEMEAETFFYLGWGGIPMPVDPCEEREVSIDFLNPAEHAVSTVSFKFVAGRLVSAKGWRMPFNTGALRGPQVR